MLMHASVRIRLSALKLLTMKITEKDFMLANRKAAREEEIEAYGKQVIFRRLIQTPKTVYNRKKFKKYKIED